MPEKRPTHLTSPMMNPTKLSRNGRWTYISPALKPISNCFCTPLIQPQKIPGLQSTSKPVANGSLTLFFCSSPTSPRQIKQHHRPFTLGRIDRNFAAELLGDAFGDVEAHAGPHAPRVGAVEHVEDFGQSIGFDAAAII